MGTNALITFQRGREGRLRNHRAAGARPAMTHALPLRRIVVGMDGSPASATAVRWAVREARLRHATVHLVCAYHGDARLRAPYASSSWTARLHQRRATARVVLDLATEAASRRLPPERLISELADEPPARDQFPVLRRLRAAGQRHDAVADGRRHAGRVD